MALPAEAKDVVIDGKRLETLRYPPTSEQTTIVLLHEGLGSVALWRNFPGTGCGSDRLWSFSVFALRAWQIRNVWRKSGPYMSSCTMKERWFSLSFSKRFI